MARCCLWLSSLLLAGACQASPAATVLSFDEALAHLWVQHPEVRQGSAQVAAAGHDVTAAYTGYLPYVQLTLAEGERGRSEHEARLVLPLWKGGLTPATVDLAKAGQRAAEFELTRMHLELGKRLTEAWFSVLALREQQALWHDYLLALEQLQGMIERRTAAGVSTEAEVMNILSRIRQADAESSMNDALLAASLAQYRALLGETFDVGSWPSARMLLSDAESLAVPERALEAHPELQLAKTSISREEADIRISRASFSPEVSLQYVRPFGDENRTQPGANEGYLQLAVQYQTDSGLRAWQGYRAGQQRLSGAQAALEANQRQVLALISADQTERQAALLQIEFQREAVSAAEAVIASSRRQFEAGRKTWVEVLNAQREAHDTRIRLVQQRRTLWQANMRLALNGSYWERLLGVADAAGQGAAENIGEGE